MRKQNENVVKGEKDPGVMLSHPIPHNPFPVLPPALLALGLRGHVAAALRGSMNERLLPPPKMLPVSSFLVVDAGLETGNEFSFLVCVCVCSAVGLLKEKSNKLPKARRCSGDSRHMRSPALHGAKKG